MKKTLRTLFFWILLSPIYPAFSQTSDWQAGVARVTTRKELVRSPGSAFIIAIQGTNAFLLTSAHVVEGDDAPKVEFFAEKSKSYFASVRAIEGGEARGLALIEVKDPPKEVLAIMPSEKTLRLGGVSIAGFPATLSTFSRVETTLTAIKGRDLFLSFLTDDGYSGGPVISDGAAVGMVYGSEGQFGKALTSASILPFLEGNDIKWGPSPSNVIAQSYGLALEEMANSAQSRFVKFGRDENSNGDWKPARTLPWAYKCSGHNFFGNPSIWCDMEGLTPLALFERILEETKSALSSADWLEDDSERKRVGSKSQVQFTHTSGVRVTVSRDAEAVQVWISSIDGQKN